MKRVAMLSFVVIAAAVLAGPVQAGELPPALAAEVDAVVERCLAQDGAPSASIAIARDGELAYAAAFGSARLAPPEKATVETRYQLASISKSFTAQALLLLEQEGKLSLDDPVEHWLPGLSGGKDATIRELLSHTAGYPDHYPQSYPAGPRGQPTTPDTLIAEWGHHPLLFAPGTQWRYSNMNYVIAGRIAEKAGGEPLFDLMQHRIFTPLGMDRTVDLDKVEADAVGYVRPALASLRPAPAEGAGWSFAAGQIVTTASDLARWDAAFLKRRLLSQRQAEEETTPATLAGGAHAQYALGLFVSNRDGRTVYSHIGQGLGFLAVNRIYPAEQAAIIVLTNSSASAAFRDIADQIEFLIVPPTAADAEARKQFAFLQAGAPDRSRFTPDFDAYLDPAMVQAYAASLGPLGPLRSFVLRSEEMTDSITARNYDVVAGGHPLSVSMLLVADGRIEQYIVQDAKR
ncbi:MAG TPA: serine hydrolase domain-containing protein [Aliidongia sp.]|nr:serine hydrolase domain-containing protein [Aliidongia sp.]